MFCHIPAPPKVVPYLLFDLYKCHLMASAVSAIKDCGVEVDFIPGGCTSLAQPVNIGINKPFKNRMRNSWEEWMLEEGLETAFTRPPSRAQVAKWTVDGLKVLPKQLVKNAWRHHNYSYFLNDPALKTYKITRRMEDANVLGDAKHIEHVEQTAML